METECKPQDNAVSSSNLAVINGNELLGSVTQPTDSESGIQLRTSARVSKKLKLDSLAQSTDKKEPIHEEEKKVEVPVGTEGKPRAKRVDWSLEDKFAFFEALNEYGKDIDAIHNYLLQKAKRRGGQEAKTKDQVRFFYYRMWSILSKHINFPLYIKKQTQELYALINFGELRKKISLSNKKHYEKLSEMIYSGSTQLKCRGKVRKVRTPLCKALRKLNQIEESSEELRLPSCVTVELRPRYNEDWCRVQALAQNPRVRSVLPLHRRLESLMAYLQQRWQSGDDKLREQLAGGEEMEGVEEEEKWTLRVGPKPGAQLTEPAVRLSEVATSSKLSLLAYEERFHPSAKQVPALLEQLPVIHRNKGRGVKRPRTDSLSEKTSTKEPEEGQEGTSKELKTLPPDIIESAVGQLLSLNCITDNAQANTISPRVNGELSSPVKEPAVEPRSLSLDQAHSGWTQVSAGAVRIGDVYMMCGFDAKIQLDYWWERCPPTPVNSSVPASVPAAVPDSAPASVPNPDPVSVPDSDPTSVLDSVPASAPASVPASVPASLLASGPSSAPASGPVPTPSTASAPTPSTASDPPAAPTDSLSPIALATTLQKLLSVAKLEMFKPKGSASNSVGSESRVHTNKSRLSKPKAHQDSVQKVDTQLKFQVCPLPLDEVFRRPIVAPLNPQNKTSDNPSLHLDKMRPRYCNRRGRPRRITPTQRLQRVVPLLPKVPPSLSLFSAVTQQGFKPIAPAPTTTIASKLAPITIDVKVAPVVPRILTPLRCDVTCERKAEPEQVSPPSLSNLLDDLSLPSSCGSRLSTPVPTFEGLLNNSQEGSLSASKDQWLTSEVADMSLSGFSFLNNLDTDIKNITDDSRLSDVDSQLRNLMNTENSSDLNDIIADLTATIKTKTEPD